MIGRTPKSLVDISRTRSCRWVRCERRRMKIVVVDDYFPILKCVAAMLQAMGHTAVTFSDPCLAVQSLGPDVDLVISDISMPGMDGFVVARQVAAKLGASPPRTLLMSGLTEYAADVAVFPPATVIGMIEKPFDFADLARVVTCLAETRSCCPGRARTMPEIPPHECSSEPMTAPCEAEPICFTREYAHCRFYASHCGRGLRTWIRAS